MAHASRFDLVTVGHFAIDTIISPRMTKPKTVLGGSPTYASVAAAKLGAKVSVVSKAGGDFPIEYHEWLKRNNVDLSGLKLLAKAPTTRFILEYENKKRKLRLQARAPSILTTDVPRKLKSKAIHVGPIANEVPSSVVTRLRKSTPTLSLDPQGFLRSYDNEGNVILKAWKTREVLTQVDIFKSASEEIHIMTRLSNLKSSMRLIADYGARTVLVTRGARGSELYFDGHFYSIPPCQSKKMIDPTGAGDAFIGAFLAEYVRGKEPLWCGCVGSASASFVVEGLGPERFGERHEVYERARGIYEKAVKKK